MWLLRLQVILAFTVAFFLLDTAVSQKKSGDVIYELRGAGNVLFSHEAHSAEGIKCMTCHARIYAEKGRKKMTMARMEKGDSCGACHNGKKAFDVKRNCARCHKRSA